jgi:hypothetical protein
MSESIPKEIIGIAKASEWNHIKEFIKALLGMTLDEDEEYSLIALNALINNKKLEEYDTKIKTKDEIKIIDSINDFEKISLYQQSEFRRNIITLSKDNEVIVLTTNYMGPEIDHTNYFDFAIYLDSFDVPYFSDNRGNVFNCSEIIKMVDRLEPESPKKQIKPKMQELPAPSDLEKSVFEKTTGNNATWNDKETQPFLKWKLKTHKAFQEKTGGMPYYRGKITQNYEKFLNRIPKQEIETEKKLQSEKTISKAKSEPKSVAKSAPKVKEKPKSKLKAKSETKSIAKSTLKARVKPKTKPKAKSAPQVRAKPKSKPKAKYEPKPIAKSASKAKAKPKSKPKAKSEIKPIAKSTLKAKAKPKIKPKTKSKTISIAKSGPKVKAKSKSKPIAKSVLKPIAKSAPKVKTKPKVKSETKAKKKI